MYTHTQTLYHLPVNILFNSNIKEYRKISDKKTNSFREEKNNFFFLQIETVAISKHTYIHWHIHMHIHTHTRMHM